MIKHKGERKMNKKTTGIVAYITIVGWLIAFLVGDKEGAKFHLNQALVLAIANLANSFVLARILGLIPVLGGILNLVISLALTVCWILGLVYAIKEEEKELPFIGAIKILK